MTDTPVSQPEAPGKNRVLPTPYLLSLLVVLILLVAILAIFGGPIFDRLAGSNDQSAPAAS